jgi:predicted dehydrogenase
VVSHHDDPGVREPSGGDELTVGVVGFGTHAQRAHVAHLQDAGRVGVTAVCDPSVEARRDAARLVDTVHGSLDELLEHADVDALVVCSPDRYHADALARCVAAGKHVLVDKPLADRSAQLPLVAGALARARRVQVVVTSCHPRRFDPPFRWLVRELPGLRARLGPALEVRVDFFYRQPSKDGLHRGLLLDHVSHEIDLVHFVFGCSPFVAHRLVDDQVRYAVAGHREDGLCFTFSGSRHLERTGYPEVLRIRFERGEVQIDTESGTATERDLDAGTTTTTPCGATDHARRFRAVNQDFVSAVLDSTAPSSSAAELLINTEIGIALHETGHYDSRRARRGGAPGQELLDSRSSASGWS